jgi:hypothetical protein
MRSQRIAVRFVVAVSWLGELDFVAELFFAVRDAVCEDNADAFIEVVAAFAWRANVEVDQIP